MKKKLMSFALAALASVTALAGCRAGKVPNTATDLEIVYWKAGHGDAYVERINQAFTDLHPEIEIHFTPIESVSNLALYASPETNTVDLYMHDFFNFLAYQEYLEPLNDILDAKVDGNDVTIGRKIGDTVDRMKEMGSETVYSLPYAASMGGLVYNAGVFREKGYREPRTTQELLDLCDRMTDDGYTPFVYYNRYWEYLTLPWIAQLDGIDGLNDHYNGVYEDENGTRYENDARSFTYYRQGGGRYESMNVLRKLVSPENYIYYGTAQLTHTDAQTYFLNGYALMQPNGTWLENEMKESAGNAEIRIMKAPVISALGNKLGISESALRAAVSYADGTATDAERRTAESLTEEQRKAVADARNIVFTHTSEYNMYIPNYSVAKEAAKEYIKFYYSDVALKIIADESHGLIPAALSEGEIDTSGWSEFSKNCFELASGASQIYKTARTPLMYRAASTGSLFHNNGAVQFAYSQNTSSMWTLEKFVAEEQNYWNSQWRTFMIQAGLE